MERLGYVTEIARETLRRSPGANSREYVTRWLMRSISPESEADTSISMSPLRVED